MQHCINLGSCIDSSARLTESHPIIWECWLKHIERPFEGLVVVVIGCITNFQVHTMYCIYNAATTFAAEANALAHPAFPSTQPLKAGKFPSSFRVHPEIDVSSLGQRTCLNDTSGLSAFWNQSKRHWQPALRFAGMESHSLREETPPYCAPGIPPN